MVDVGGSVAGGSVAGGTVVSGASVVGAAVSGGCVELVGPDVGGTVAGGSVAGGSVVGSTVVVVAVTDVVVLLSGAGGSGTRPMSTPTPELPTGHRDPVRARRQRDVVDLGGIGVDLVVRTDIG